MSATPKHYLVYWQEDLVLEIRDEPGPLISKPSPPPPPGEETVQHPFLSATAYAPEHEGVLREALDRSDNLSEYLSTLQAMGFRVVEQTV